MHITRPMAADRSAFNKFSPKVVVTKTTTEYVFQSSTLVVESVESQVHFW